MSESTYDDHIVTVCPEELAPPTTPTGESSSSSSSYISISVDEITEYVEDETHVDVVTPPEEADLSEEKGQCRYCHEEDLVCMLESPCACSGSLKYAHRTCILCWCRAKGNTICEICRQAYAPNYSLNDDLGPNRDGFTSRGTQIQAPELVPVRNVPVHQYWNLKIPGRGLFYGTIFVLFLTMLILWVIHSATSWSKDGQDPHTAIDAAYFIFMIVLALLSLLTCLYESRYLEERRAERNRRA